MRIAALLIGIVGAIGCMSVGRFPNLPASDRDRFMRCRMAIEPARCGTITSEMYEMECVRSAEHDYAEGQTERDRKEWLMANGCPPAMAER